MDFMRKKFLSVVIAFFTVFSLGLSQPQPVHAQENEAADSLNTAIEAFNGGDYETAVPLLEALADEQDREALLYLGYCYQNGYYVQADLDTAFDLFLTSAQYDLAAAMTEVGYCYLNGYGVGEDPDTAYQWFFEAARKGNALGMYDLGICYENGFGTSQDLTQAYFWFNRSYEMGYKNAKEKADQYEECVSRISEDPAQWGDPSSWSWGKGYYIESGYPVIFNKELFAGIRTDSKQQSDTYLNIIYAVMPDRAMSFRISGDGSENYFMNTTGSTLNLTLTITTNALTSESFEVYMPDQDNRIYLEDSYGVNSLEDKIRTTDIGDTILEFVFPDGATYSFHIPAGNDYRKVWYYVSDFWSIPTDNYDIYTGSDVYPDLISFLSKYDTAVLTAIDSILAASDDLSLSEAVDIIENSMELEPLMEQYRQLPQYTYRTVDVNYIADNTSNLCRDILSKFADAQSYEAGVLFDLFTLSFD